jgi:hypothetical protein
MIRLEATSPLLRAAIVAERPAPDRAAVTTYLWFERPAVMRVLWDVVGPLHRSVARYLLARAAAMTKERV